MKIRTKDVLRESELPNGHMYANDTPDWTFIDHTQRIELNSVHFFVSAQTIANCSKNYYIMSHPRVVDKSNTRANGEIHDEGT